MNASKSARGAWRNTVENPFGSGKWYVVLGTQDNCEAAGVKFDQSNPVVLFSFGIVGADGELSLARRKPEGWQAKAFASCVAFPVDSLYVAQDQSRLSSFGIGSNLLNEARDLVTEEKRKFAKSHSFRRGAGSAAPVDLGNPLQRMVAGMAQAPVFQPE